MTYESRAPNLQSEISKRLFQIVCRKRTNLCVKLSSSDFDQLLKTADQIGPHISILGVHLDLFESYELNRMHELRRIAQNHEFLLLDDRYIFPSCYMISLLCGNLNPYPEIFVRTKKSPISSYGVSKLLEKCRKKVKSCV